MPITGMQPQRGQPEGAQYEIVVKGYLDARWTRRFAGMTVSSLPGERTLLAGPVADQPALHGLLNTIRDLGLTLVSVALCEDR